MWKAENHELLVRFGGAQCSNYKGIGVRATRDRKSRLGDPGDFRNGGLPPREALGIRCRKVDNQAHDRQGLERNASDSEPAHFDEAAKRLGRAHQQAAVCGFDMDTIVTHEAREGEGVPACLNERERKA
jgi:hypothetical protein